MKTITYQFWRQRPEGGKILLNAYSDGTIGPALEALEPKDEWILPDPEIEPEREPFSTETILLLNPRRLLNRVSVTLGTILVMIGIMIGPEVKSGVPFFALVWMAILGFVGILKLNQKLNGDSYDA